MTIDNALLLKGTSAYKGRYELIVAHVTLNERHQ